MAPQSTTEHNETRKSPATTWLIKKVRMTWFSSRKSGHSATWSRREGQTGRRGANVRPRHY